MYRSNAGLVLAQLPDAFTHFNEVRPHSSVEVGFSSHVQRELARRAQENGVLLAIGGVRVHGGKIAAARN